MGALRALVRKRNVRSIVFHVARNTAHHLQQNPCSSASIDLLRAYVDNMLLHHVTLLKHTTDVMSTSNSTLHVVEEVAQLTRQCDLITDLPPDIQRFAADVLGLRETPPSETRLFGDHLIAQDYVFHETSHSFCLVNLKPIVPGHVLVIPKRCVGRFSHLGKDEVSDLWTTAQLVGGIVETEYQASSLTFAIQDGPAAGQTVDHVHIHVLPRSIGDFPGNDDVYVEIEKHNQQLHVESAERLSRSVAEMSEEAARLRQLFNS